MCRNARGKARHTPPASFRKWQPHNAWADFDGASLPWSVAFSWSRTDDVGFVAGRPQLLLYHFMFAPGVNGWPNAGCPGCSMFLDNIGQFAPVHLKARGVCLAVVSRAPLANIEAYRKRMSWPHRWVSCASNSFNVDFGLTTDEGEMHGLSVFLRDGDDIFRTYFTSRRGSEALGNVWGFLDATPFGRQEEWEDSPRDWPQTPPYQWWRRHDEYERG